MSDDDWSCVDLKEDEWTEVEADDEDSQWSILSDENKPTSQSSVVSHVNIPIKTSAFLRREIREMEDEEEDGSSDIKDYWRRKRCGKRALKYSLVRRIGECDPYGMDAFSDGYIESMPGGVDESRLSAKTPVDDLVPTLTVKSTATLGRAQYSKKRDDGHDCLRRKYDIKHNKSSRKDSRKSEHRRAYKHSQIKFDIDDALTWFEYEGYYDTSMVVVCVAASSAVDLIQNI